MTAESLTPQFRMAPRAHSHLTWAEFVNILQSVTFYGILGIGLGVPIAVPIYGLLFR